MQNKFDSLEISPTKQEYNTIIPIYGSKAVLYMSSVLHFALHFDISNNVLVALTQTIPVINKPIFS